MGQIGFGGTRKSDPVVRCRRTNPSFDSIDQERIRGAERGSRPMLLSSHWFSYSPTRARVDTESYGCHARQVQHALTGWHLHRAAVCTDQNHRAGREPGFREFWLVRALGLCHHGSRDSEGAVFSCTVASFELIAICVIIT